MADIRIGIRDKAIRNLVVVALIPIVIFVWVGLLELIYLYQKEIWMTEGWFALVILFVIVSIIEFFAIVYINLK